MTGNIFTAEDMESAEVFIKYSSALSDSLWCNSIYLPIKYVSSSWMQWHLTCLTSHYDEVWSYARIEPRKERYRIRFRSLRLL